MSCPCRFEVRPTFDLERTCGPERIAGEQRGGAQGWKTTESPGLGFHEPAGHRDGGRVPWRAALSPRVHTVEGARELGSPSDKGVDPIPGPPFLTSSDPNPRPQTRLQAPHMAGGSGVTDIQSTAVHLGSQGSVLHSGKRTGAVWIRSPGS